MDYVIYKIVEGKKKKIGMYSGITEAITITE